MSMEDDTKKCIVCGRYNSEICSGCYNDNKDSYNDIRNSVLDEAIAKIDKLSNPHSSYADTLCVSIINLKSALLNMKKEMKTG